jgi:uridine phosphorylase
MLSEAIWCTPSTVRVALLATIISFPSIEAMSDAATVVSLVISTVSAETFFGQAKTIVAPRTQEKSFIGNTWSESIVLINIKITSAKTRAPI